MVVNVCMARSLYLSKLGRDFRAGTDGILNNSSFFTLSQAISVETPSWLTIISQSLGFVKGNLFADGSETSLTSSVLFRGLPIKLSLAVTVTFSEFGELAVLSQNSTFGFSSSGSETLQFDIEGCPSEPSRGRQNALLTTRLCGRGYSSIT